MGFAELLEVILLGIIQGLTEFLPVSSSGHLELAKALFGQDRIPQESLTLTVLLHVGTALATIGVFRKDIVDLFKGLFKHGEERNYAVYIVISMLPAALIGVFFEDSFSYFFDGKIALVGLCLWLTALLLFFSEKKPSGKLSINSKSAIIIGFSQAVALLPGVSRSGSTIATALMLGIEQKRAARFSFLMVIPLILGKVGKDVLFGDIELNSAVLLPGMIGMLAAFVTGWFACVWMIQLVQDSRLRYFAYYCFVVGTIAVISQFV